MLQRSAFLNESDFDTLTSLAAAFESMPLVMVKPTDKSLLMVLLDLNTFGVTDHQPLHRVCPIGKEKLSLPIRAVLKARLGTDTPSLMERNVLWVCISGGRDRERLFKSFFTPQKDKPPPKADRALCNKLMIHITEESWRERRKRKRGRAKLVQSIYMLGHNRTLSAVKHTKFPVHEGSTKSNVMGPVKLDPLDTIPHIDPSLVRDFFGKRYVLAGGKLEDTSDDDNDDSESDEASPQKAHEGEKKKDDKKDVKKDDKVPLMPHALPVSVVTDLIEAFNVKHIIDLFPTPCPLAYKVLASGGSYVGLTATPMMQNHIKKQLYNDLILGHVNPKEQFLYDARFSRDVAEASQYTVANGSHNIINN